MFANRLIEIILTLFNLNVVPVNAKMIFLIKSAVGHGNAREILRRTWTKVSYNEGFQFSSVFVLGRTDLARQALIDEEYDRYGDILQLNIPDEYR